VEIRPGRWTLDRISRTFHGRDIFAPAAAHLSRGVALSHLGPPASDMVQLDLPPNSRAGVRVATRIVHRDTFGNLVTLLHRSEVEGKPVSVQVGGEEIPVRDTYGDVAPGELLACWGSADYLEIAVNRGSASRRLESEPGTAVEVLLAGIGED